jgi:hypothetical protein
MGNARVDPVPRKSETLEYIDTKLAQMMGVGEDTIACSIETLIVIDPTGIGGVRFLCLGG